MRPIWLVLASLLLSPVYSPAQPVRTVYTSPSGNSIPYFDRGYQLLPEHPNTLVVHGQDGGVLFRTIVKGPNGEAISMGAPATNGEGVFATGISFMTPNGYDAAIVTLDRTGKQTSLIPTGRFLACHLTFDGRGNLWATGWQRAAKDNAHEDPENYPMIRRFDRQGKQTGAFLSRKLFPPWGAPFACGGGWVIRAAKDRIGAIAHPSFAGQAPEWVEWTLDGELIGRWKFGHGERPEALTEDGRLWFQGVDATVKPPRPLLFELNRETGRRVRADVIGELPLAPLVGADGNRLVYLTDDRTRLQWFDVK